MNQWVPPDGHIHEDFFNGGWRIKWLFGNVSGSFATCGVHGSAIACLRNAWESHAACTGLPCDVPGVILGDVALVGVPNPGAPAPAAQPKANWSRELPVPKLSLAFRHRCQQGVGEGKGAKHLEAKGGDDLLRNTCQVYLHLTWHCRHQLQLLLHHLCRAATMAVRAAALHHRPLAWADLMNSAILAHSYVLLW